MGRVFRLLTRRQRTIVGFSAGVACFSTGCESRLARQLRLAVATFGACFLTTVTASSTWADEDSREAVYERYLEISDLVIGGIVEPAWLPDGIRFPFTESGEDGTVTYEYDPVSRSRKRVTVVPVEASARAADEPRQVGRDTFGIPLYEILSPDKQWFLHRSANDLSLRKAGSDQLVQLTDDGTE